MNKYRNIIRLQNWNYGWNGDYFVTICTRYRVHFFGEIFKREMHLTEIGLLAKKFWSEIPDHFPFVHLGQFVVMPNHIHGIIIIRKPAWYFNDTPVSEQARNPIHHNDPALKNGITEGTRHCLVPTIYDIKHNFNFKGKIFPVFASDTKTIGQQRFQNQGKITLSSIVGSYKSMVTRYARKIDPDFGWQSRFYDRIIRSRRSYRAISHYIMNNPANWVNDRFYVNTKYSRS